MNLKQQAFFIEHFVVTPGMPKGEMRHARAIEREEVWQA